VRGDLFVIDSSWLQVRGARRQSRERQGHHALGRRTGADRSCAREANVGSPAVGRGAKLGIPRQTLESKMRALKIDRRRFKLADPSALTAFGSTAESQSPFTEALSRGAALASSVARGRDWHGLKRLTCGRRLL